MVVKGLLYGRVLAIEDCQRGWCLNLIGSASQQDWSNSELPTAMVFSPLPSTLLCPKPRSLGTHGALWIIFYGCVVLRLFLPSSRFSVSWAAVTKRASSVDPILYWHCLLPISLDLLMFQEDLIFLLSVYRTHLSYCSQFFSRNMGIRATGLMPLSRFVFFHYYCDQFCNWDIVSCQLREGITCGFYFGGSRFL